MVDKKKAVKMMNEGLTDVVIAKRLGCSTRTIRRIKKSEGVVKPYIIDREIEIFKRQLYLDLGESGQSVGERFSISRQAVLNLT